MITRGAERQIDREVMSRAMSDVGEALDGYSADLWIPTLLNVVGSMYVGLYTQACGADPRLADTMKARLRMDLRTLMRLVDDPAAVLAEVDRHGHALAPE